MNNIISVKTLARRVTQHPLACLGIALVLTVLSVWRIPTLTVKMDIAALLPADSEVVSVYQSALDDFGNNRSNFDFMLGVVEATTEEGRQHLKTAAEELAFALNDQRYVSRVNVTLDPESLALDTPRGQSQAVALLTNEDWQVLEQKFTEKEIDAAMQRLRGLLIALPRSRLNRILDDPLNFYEVLDERVKIKSGPLKVNLRDSYFISEDGSMLLVLVWPVGPATDIAFARDFKDFLDASVAGVYKRNPQFGPPGENVTLAFVGPHYEAISDSELVKNDLFRTSIVSFFAVTLLFIFAFRRPEALLFVAIPLVVGVTWTLGLASVTVGRLTQVTIALSAILIGLGIDFGIHLYNRYLEESTRGRDNREALRLAIIETGPGVIAGALTTAVAFLGMMVTRFEGFRELGLMAGFGVICCLVAVILVLPPLLIWFGRGPEGVFTHRPIPGFGLKQFYFTTLAYPRITVLVGLIIAGWLGMNALDIEFEDDFRYLKQPTPEYEDLRKRIGEHFQVPVNQLIVIAEGATLEEALEDNDRLFLNISAAERARYPLVAKDSLRYFIPSQRTQKESLERMANRDLAADRQQVAKVAEKYRISPLVFDKFFANLESYQSASRDALRADTMPISLTSKASERSQVLSSLSQRYMSSRQDRWRVLTQIYPPPTEEWVGSVPEPFISTIGQGLRNKVDVTGSAILQQELRRMVIQDLAKTVIVVLICVLFLLVLLFRSFFRALLALVPVILAMLCMLGVMNVLGMTLHYVNIIAFPIVIGIGVDSGIHLLQRYYENDAMDLKKAILRTGRAVVITGMTTIFGLGSLALADFKGIHDLGILCIIGVGLTLVSSVLILPAIIRLTQFSVVDRGGPGDDLG